MRTIKHNRSLSGLHQRLNGVTNPNVTPKLCACVIDLRWMFHCDMNLTLNLPQTMSTAGCSAWLGKISSSTRVKASRLKLRKCEHKIIFSESEFVPVPARLWRSPPPWSLLLLPATTIHAGFSLSATSILRVRSSSRFLNLRSKCRWNWLTGTFVGWDKQFVLRYIHCMRSA